MTEVSSSNPPIIGVIMAGGLSRRMGGGDKCEIVLEGKTLLQRVIERALPQVDQLILNANGDLSRFNGYGLPLAPDCVEDFAGPLAGILTGMLWARENAPDCRWVASFASDTPFFPLDLVSRMAAELESGEADIAYAKSDGQKHPVFGLWPVRLYPELRHALLEEELRRMGAWIDRYPCAEVCYDTEPYDPFFNLNTPQDVERARGLV